MIGSGGGLGVAAYHPEAAALAGSSTPGQRSRAMSIFATGGFLGQSIAPYYSGAIDYTSSSIWSVVSPTGPKLNDPALLTT